MAKAAGIDTKTYKSSTISLIQILKNKTIDNIFNFIFFYFFFS